MFIALVSLLSESDRIDGTIGKHEMFRKDEVKAYKNILAKYLDVIDNTIRDYKLNNIEIVEGKIQLLPANIVTYDAKNVTVEYFPEAYLEKLGNDPTYENIKAGTDSGYWLSKIIVEDMGRVGATVTLDFDGLITFNMLRINLVGKYAPLVEKLEVYDIDHWEEVDFTGFEYEKRSALSLTEDKVSTQYIRITIVQEKPDYLWEVKVDNIDEILEDEGKTKAINDTFKGDFYLNKEVTYEGVYEYLFGAYNIVPILKMYKDDGYFLSKKYKVDDVIRDVKVKATESKPESSAITYSAILQDESSVSLTLGNVTAIDKEFLKYETRSNLTSNYIELSSYPLLDPDKIIYVKVNGKDAIYVDKFTQSGKLEYYVRGNRMYFNENLTGKLVNVFYTHYTDTIVIKIDMTTNETDDDRYTIPSTPSISDLEVYINGQRVN